MEKLKQAIDKARAQREAEGKPLGAVRPVSPTGKPEPLVAEREPRRPPLKADNPTVPLDLTEDRQVAAPKPSANGQDREHFSWMRLEPLEMTPSRLRSNRVIARDRSDNASVSFDVLRARVLKAFRDKGWRRLAITSPSKGCGKTFVSTNLALSVSRQPELKTLLVDMDLRRPAVSSTLGQRGQWRIRSWLDGSTSFERHLRRVGDNLAVAMNAESLRDASELILSSRTIEVLDTATQVLDPDLVIYDLPPALVNDDVFNFLPNVDAVLLVAAAGLTTPDQIESCEQLFENNCAFLGVLLNKVQDGGEQKYGYGY